MRLQRLTGLERDKIDNEYKELMERITYLESILADESKLFGVIKDEMLAIKDKYADPRRTEIKPAEGEIALKDLYEEEE